jgi:serine protease Do
LIITNSHVVGGDGAQVELADGRILDAKVISRDHRRDLVALGVKASGLSAVTVGDSGSLRVGELVLAVGNPLGHVGALTAGIVHAADRQWVQADLRLAPGNSGGPLANARGEVVGINSMVARGLALAVPSKAVKHFLASWRGGGQPRLGITVRPLLLSFEGRQALGLIILGVCGGSIAEKAGLMIGDILVRANGHHFRAPEDLILDLGVTGRGSEALELELVRGGGRMILTAVISAEGGGVGAA